MTTPELLSETETNFFTFLGGDAPKSRVTRLLGLGMQTRGETELNLPRHL
jgi:hypothetical protein